MFAASARPTPPHVFSPPPFLGSVMFFAVGNPFRWMIGRLRSETPMFNRQSLKIEETDGRLKHHRAKSDPY